jgi:hypothetical protein
VVRNPLSVRRLVHLDGQQAVIYRALKPSPSLGQNFNQAAVQRILDHLGLNLPETERPPPDARYVPVDDKGRETAATPRVAGGS